MMSKLRAAGQQLAALRVHFIAKLIITINYSLFTINCVLLLSCSYESSESYQSMELQQQKPIAFAAYTAMSTRSSEVYSADRGFSEGQSMGVYAYLHDNTTWSAAATPNFMWNQQATSAEKGQFNYSPLKYWPNEISDKVSFIAYFPYTNAAIVEADPANPVNPVSTASTGLTPLLANNETGLPTFNFTVKDAANQQVDFLLSELLANLPNGTNNVSPSNATDRSELTVVDRVHFVFRHMLAKVEFRISADPEVRRDIAHFHLNSLSLSNLYKNGLLTPTYSAGTTTYAWTEHTTKHGVNPTYSLPVTTYVPYLLMPQELSNDVELSLDYTITFKSDGTTYHYDDATPVADQEYTYRNTATIQLNEMKLSGSSDPLEEWLPNHYYVYNIRLRANRIDFTGPVVEWGQEVMLENIVVEE